MELPELTFKNLVVGGAALVVSSVISGYFFSIGADLWQVTKEQNVPSSISPFWYVSVPLAGVGIVLLILAVLRKPLTKAQPKPPQHLPSAIDGEWYQNKIKEQLLEIRTKLDETNDPKDIYFSMWNEKVYQKGKKGWVGNAYDAIELFSSCLNERNTFLRAALEKYGYESTSPMIRPDFIKLNRECIIAYNDLSAIGFLPRGSTPQIEVTLAKVESEQFKEFQVKLSDGREPLPAYAFYYS